MRDNDRVKKERTLMGKC